MSEVDALVVGGGISGLSLAHCLSRSGLSVEVWEGEGRIGGKIRTHVKEGYLLESAASMMVSFGSGADPFLRSAGVAAMKQHRASGAGRYIVDGNRVREVPAGLAGLVCSPLLSGRGKLRLLAEPFVPRGSAPHESIAQFVTRRFGREILDKFFDPFVSGPLASDAGLAEARSTMPKLAALEARHGSVALGMLRGRRSGGGRPEMFSFSGGMQSLVDSLARGGGFRVRGGTRATEIEPVRGGWKSRGLSVGSGSATVFSRRLFLCTPAAAAASLVRGVDTELARLLGEIEYAPLKVVHAGFERSRLGRGFAGAGFLVPRGSAFAPNGCQWMSNLFADRAPPGRVLVTSYLGGARHPAAADWEAARCADSVMWMLRDVLDVKADPDMIHVEAHPAALPLYHGAYSTRIRAIEQRLGRWAGLHLEGNYLGGVSVRDRIARAERVAAALQGGPSVQERDPITPRPASMSRDFAPAAAFR